MSDNKEYLRSLVDDKMDPALGERVRLRMEGSGLETPRQKFPEDPDFQPYQPKAAVEALRIGISNGMGWLGLDMRDPSLKDTPRRFAAMFVGELTKGLDYSLFPKCTAIPNGSGIHGLETPPQGSIDEMVLVRNIQVLSLCEHHLQTIDGFAHIAYIPRTKILGLSKFARVTEFFARRPQVQERLTSQIWIALNEILETDDIAVVLDATHFCMRARGVQQHSASTQTNKLGGKFLAKPALRQEFFDACRT